MHDIWNPWHGCVKCSEGCQNCYMYFLDRMRGQNGHTIYRTKNMRYPISKDRQGNYKIKSGEQLRVCMTSDFFLEEADTWRPQAWDIIRARRDVKFFLLTKRPQRAAAHLPSDWGNGWDHVFFNVTCENQKRADERIPLLFDLPFKHKGIMTAPLIGSIDLSSYLPAGIIEQVLCGGENYDGSRPCHYEWVKQLSDQCRQYDVTFSFIETGSVFVKDGKTYHIPNKQVQAKQAYRSGLSYTGKPIQFHLVDDWGFDLRPEQLYVPHYHPITCRECGSRMTCNGCADCGRCQD
ncbi:MAG: DUF5131 family protein [Lachnospiraceae bacterium]|nr:DUF5131 family protein [Lachnospiraceae bacterium]